MASPRYAKVAEQIKVIVAEMLERRIKDPRLGFVTVTDVRLTGDGREATVFYTVLGDADARAETALALHVGHRAAALDGRQAARHEVHPDAGLRAGRRRGGRRPARGRARPGPRHATRRSPPSAVGATYAGDADPYKHADEDDDDERPPTS